MRLARTFSMAAALAVMSLAVTVAHAEPAGKGGATVERWAGGLQAPQGIGRDVEGRVYVAENGSGRVLRFSRDGKQSEVYAEGLKAPSFALLSGATLYVAERTGNSVARIPAQGTVERLSGEVIDPLGLAFDPKKPADLFVVSHRQSLVRRFAAGDGGGLTLHADTVLSPRAGARYGWRDLAVAADGTLYVTDEISRAILRRKPGGELEPWVTELSSPSGLLLTSGGGLYVTEEGNGRVSHVAADGKVTVLAEGLGQARAAVLLDERTLLVTDRKGGDVWKVTLPR